MLNINSLPQFIQPFAQFLDPSEKLLLIASLETLRHSFNNTNIQADAKLNSTLHTTRETVREYAKDIEIKIEQLCWHKTCRGWHEIKLAGGKSKTEANEIRRNKHKEFEANPMISEIKTENRGKCKKKKYDPFIMFKHVDNCPECNSLPTLVSKKNRVPALNVLDLVENKNSQTDEKIMLFYESVSKYLFF